MDLLALLSTFLISFVCLFVLRALAPSVGLVDKPSGRKKHKGVIPLVGGIAVFISFSSFLLIAPLHGLSTALYLGCALVMLFVGVFDDRFDLRVRLRMGIQLMVTLVMMFAGGLWLQSLGDLIGVGDIGLSFAGLGYLITIAAVIGAINAFNMVDGVDGLLGGLALVTFAMLAWLFYHANEIALASFCLAWIVALIPYVMLNLGFPFGTRYKVFMGDAGSMVIGFTVIWLLLEATQGSEAIIKPVTALWLIALPLMDMAAIMVRRIQKGQSPFKPDRDHLHHILLRVGLTPIQTVLAICVVELLLAAIGVLGDLNGLPQVAMFITFLVLFMMYALAIKYIWRLTSFVRRYNYFTR